MRNDPTQHIKPSQANWTPEAELELIEFGVRVFMALDNETCGWSALDDLSYEKYMRENP